MRSITRSIAAFAAAATVTGAGIIGATSAFAAGDPGTWSGTLTVNSTTSILLSSNAFALTANPGDPAVYTNAAGDFGSPKELLTIGSNDSKGYTVTETDTQQFTNGTSTIPMQLFINDGTHYVTFAANETETEHISTSATGAMTKTPSTDGSPYSNVAGNDLYPEGAGVAVPAGATTGTYTSAVEYAVLGN